MLKPKVIYTSIVIVAAIAVGVNKHIKDKRRDIKTAALVDFERVVKPLLHDHCERCHGPEMQKANLRLDSLAAVMKGGYSGPAVTGGRVYVMDRQLSSGATNPASPSSTAP